MFLLNTSTKKSAPACGHPSQIPKKNQFKSVKICDPPRRVPRLPAGRQVPSSNTSNQKNQRKSAQICDPPRRVPRLPAGRQVPSSNTSNQKNQFKSAKICDPPRRVPRSLKSSTPILKHFYPSDTKNLYLCIEIKSSGNE